MAGFLNGLEIPFLLFGILFIASFLLERKSGHLVILAILGRFSMMLVPVIKYVWYQGVWIDQSTQYALASNVVSTGSILQHSSLLPFQQYTASPLIHVFVSTFSIISELPLASSIAILPVLFSPIYPILTYAIIKKMGLVAKNNILKYALFFSAIPFSWTQYQISGTTFGLLLAFISIYLFVSLIQKWSKLHLFSLIVVLFALAALHTVTSILLTAILLFTFLFQRGLFKTKKIAVSLIVLVMLICAIWLLFSSHIAFTDIMEQVLVSVPSGTTPNSERLPSTFFQLASADVFSAITTLSVYYGATVIFALLSVIGIAVFFRKGEKTTMAIFLTLFCSLIFIGAILGTFLQAGGVRALSFGEILFPIFSGIAVYWARKKIKFSTLVIFSLIFILATLQFYAAQPLIPQANVIYEDLPENVPIAWVNVVNSIYQRQVIQFALNHFDKGLIASDFVTYNQIVGMADSDFVASHLTHYNPLEPRQTVEEYNLLIVHYAGKAGILSESAQNRSPDKITQTLYNSRHSIY